MKGGHNRKTVSQHLQAGSLRPARHAEKLVAASARAPKKPPRCPKELAGEALALWRMLVKELKDVVGATDGPTLALLCVTHADLMRSALKLATLDPGTEEHGRLSRSMGRMHDTYAKLAEKFGLSPIDRERIPVSPTESIDGIRRW